MRLVAFGGKKGSGKDTMARLVAEFAPTVLGCGARVQTYYLAEPIKECAARYFGVPLAWMRGSAEDKDRVTAVCWESLPNYFRLCVEASSEGRQVPKGPMTVREVMQQVGENLFLDANPRCWLDPFRARIEAESDRYELGVVADLRKPEQVFEIQSLGGRVVYLLRDPNAGRDRHISETALEPGSFSRGRFDAVVDNRNQTVEETWAEVSSRLSVWWA